VNAIVPALALLLSQAPDPEVAYAEPGVPTKAYAVIVANNHSTDGSLAPLSFADDDGARYFELFSTMADRVELLSVLDAETQGRHPGAAARARPPSRAELLEVLESTFAAIARDKKAGVRTIFYFIYAGHGSVGATGQGEMHLLDGRFSRAQLFQEVVAPSPATINHLIIDACNAYLLVARRGGQAPNAAEMDAAVKSFLQKESLDRYPNTGVLVSTSKAADVHEWRRFSAGIFSHEVRSGLAGAADVNRDGQVRYDEIRAFIGAANGKIPDPQARLEVHARPPAIHLSEALFDRRLAKNAPIAQIPPSRWGRAYLEDQRGVRYADFNLANDGPIEITLVPAEAYFLRSDQREVKIPLGAQARIDVGALEPEPIMLASRGSEDLTYQQFLFAVPFGQAYFEGYRASAQPESSAELVLTEEEGTSPLRVVAVSAGVLGVAAAAVGAGFYVASTNDAAAYRSRIGSATELDGLRADAESKATTANILYGVGAGLLLTGVVTWLVAD
jgi:hypothetical protein